MKIDQASTNNMNLQLLVKGVGKKNDQQSKQPQEPITEETKTSPEYDVDLSAEGAKKAQDLNDKLKDKLQKEEEKLGYIRYIEEMGLSEGADANQLRIAMKCYIIATRIMKGDEVPYKDHEYLRKHDPELYVEAIKHKMPNLDPKKHDRLSEDEEDSAEAAEEPTEIESVDLGGAETAAETSTDNTES